MSVKRHDVLTTNRRISRMVGKKCASYRRETKLRIDSRFKHVAAHVIQRAASMDARGGTMKLITSIGISKPTGRNINRA